MTGFPYDVREFPERHLPLFQSFLMRAQGIRRDGSAALNLCYLATGRFDGFWELSLKSWDVAATGLIAEEGGAIVTSTDGKPDYISSPQSILAAAPGIYKQLLEQLK